MTNSVLGNIPDNKKHYSKVSCSNFLRCIQGCFTGAVCHNNTKCIYFFLRCTAFQTFAKIRHYQDPSIDRPLKMVAVKLYKSSMRCSPFQWEVEICHITLPLTLLIVLKDFNWCFHWGHKEKRGSVMKTDLHLFVNVDLIVLIERSNALIKRYLKLWIGFSSSE